MILPIGDTPNAKGFVPWVNWLVIGVNVLVYLLLTLPESLVAADPRDPALREYLGWLARQLPYRVPLGELAASVSGWDLVVFEHGFRPAHPELADLFTAMFMHAGFAHLAGNMLFLWIYGDNVEHRLGHVRYLLAYLGTGAAATLLYSVVARGSGVPLVGASGAISGALGFYFLAFPRNRVKLLVFFFPFFVDVFLVSARLVLGFYVVVDNLLPLVAGGQGSGVAYGAHLGGVLAGVGVAWLAGLGRRGRPADGAASPAQVQLDLARRYLGLGQPVAAYHHLLRVLEIAPHSAEAAEARHLLQRLLEQAEARSRWQR